MCDKKYLIVGNNAVANTTLKASIDKLASSLMNTGECTSLHTLLSMRPPTRHQPQRLTV